MEKIILSNAESIRKKAIFSSFSAKRKPATMNRAGVG
jgi:hypothetical protein